MRKKLTTTDFIKRAKKIHGEKYNYSKVNYNNPKTKVEIICKEHGSFWQLPYNHIQEHGCLRCFNQYKQGKARRLTRKQFIENAKKIHGKNKYDYSKSIYRNCKTKIEIICKEHGSFWQSPRGHLNKRGCRKCGIVKSKNAKFKNTKQFIENAKKIHGKNKYDYSKSIYRNCKTKIEIICSKHGSFWQLPPSHLKGHACPKCSGNANFTLEEFIKKAKKIHGYKYIYDKVIYKNCDKKVKIYCCKCKKYFLQIPYNHINLKYGCNQCTISKGEERIKTILDRYDVPYIHQKRFKKCKDKKRLPFDFYLPDYNILIEYDGIQHFKRMTAQWHDTQEQFKLRKLHDRIKDRFARENNIKLIRIPYFKIHSITKILRQDLKLSKHDFTEFI